MAEVKNEDYLKQQEDSYPLLEKLVAGKHMPNGGLIPFDRLVDLLGLDRARTFDVVHYTKDRGWLEVHPGDAFGSLSARERAIGRQPNETRPFDASFRLTEEGLAYVKDEIALRYQLKQLGEFDNAVWRGKWSFRISFVSLVIAGAVAFDRIATNGKSELPQLLEPEAGTSKPEAIPSSTPPLVPDSAASTPETRRASEGVAH